MSRSIITRNADGALIAANRRIAGRLGMDPDYTVSTNVARAIAPRLGVDVPTAKRLFHGVLAGLVGTAVRSRAGGGGAIVAGGAFWLWLESFDDSATER
jgi:hypothetical protein